MIWLNPAAVLGVLAIAGPIAVHLLRRQQRRRVVIPTIRFVSSVSTSALRLRWLDDPFLLLLRVGIIVAAVLALAGPLALTSSRVEGWNERIARAVVADTSPSAQSASSPDFLRAEVDGAYRARVFEADELKPAIARAIAWLALAPPARREIVVLSDFQLGVVSGSDLGLVPHDIGLRLMSSRTASAASRDISMARLVFDGSAYEQSVRLDEWQTSAWLNRADADPFSRLSVEGATPEDADWLRRVVARAGAVSGDGERRLLLRFGALASGSPQPSGFDGATFATAQRVLTAWGDRTPPVGISGAEKALVIEADVRPRSIDAATLMKMALDAQREPDNLLEAEIVRIPEATLRAWWREPAPVGPEAARRSDEHDGRWLWGGALLLLAVEAMVRRGGPRTSQKEVRADAA